LNQLSTQVMFGERETSTSVCTVDMITTDLHSLCTFTVLHTVMTYCHMIMFWNFMNATILLPVWSQT